MMMHLPVVATDVGAVSELVEHGVTGLVVPPLDARALARAILEAAEPASRAAMGARARERAARLCSTEHCARVHLKAYDKAREHRASRLHSKRIRRRAGKHRGHGLESTLPGQSASSDRSRGSSRLADGAANDSQIRRSSSRAAPP
jgi:hypothetical protein